MSYQSVRNYVSNKQIPQLFESLMAALMYYRPEDHISYVQECLRKIKQGKISGGDIRWNSFISAESSRSRDLPPVNRKPAKSKLQQHSSRRTDSQNALPPIPDGQMTRKQAQTCSLYHCNKLAKDLNFPPFVVFVVGLQQSLLKDLCQEVMTQNPGVRYLDMEDMMKPRMAVEGFTDFLKVPPCSIIDVLIRASCSADKLRDKDTALLVSDFPRSVSDCQEWMSKITSSSKSSTESLFYVLVLEESSFLESLEEQVKEKTMNKTLKTHLEEKHRSLREILERYQSQGAAEVVAPVGSELMSSIRKHFEHQ